MGGPLPEALGHEVIVADPNFAPMYATRTRKVKTDRRDARALALPGPSSTRTRPSARRPSAWGGGDSFARLHLRFPACPARATVWLPQLNPSSRPARKAASTPSSLPPA